MVVFFVVLVLYSFRFCAGYYKIYIYLSEDGVGRCLLDSKVAVSCIEAIAHELPYIMISFDSDGNGYALCVCGLVYDSDKKLIRDIARKKCLMTREEGERVVIYSPASGC